MKIPFVFKKCSKCGRWLVANIFNFSKEKHGKYGLRGECKECNNAYKRKLRAGDIEPHKKECPDGYKKCTKCGRVLVANTDNFHKKKTGKYGLTGRCKECANAYSREYYEENSEDILKQEKEYRLNNKEKIAECDKKRYEKNKETILKRCRKYHKTPQGQVAIFNRHNKRRQREEQQGKGITEQQWLEMMRFFDWKCAYSGKSISSADNRSIDHIVPLAKGGFNEIWNCVPMYRPFNSSKHTKDLEEWYTQQDFYSEDRLNKINAWREYAYNKWSNKVNTKTI